MTDATGTGMAAACAAAPALGAPWPEPPSRTRPMTAAATALTVKPTVVAEKRMVSCSDDYSPWDCPKAVVVT